MIPVLWTHQKASIAALEYSLTSNHIAAFGKNWNDNFNMMIFLTVCGPDSADLLLPITKYFQSLKLPSYSPSQLSLLTFSSPINFPNLRTIMVSDYYLTENYVSVDEIFRLDLGCCFCWWRHWSIWSILLAQFSDSGLYFLVSTLSEPKMTLVWAHWVLVFKITLISKFLFCVMQLEPLPMPWAICMKNQFDVLDVCN